MKNQLITKRELDRQEIRDAEELFMKHGPDRCWAVVREMRAMGWEQFKISELTGRPQTGAIGLAKANGWLEKYNEAAKEQEEQEQTVDEITVTEEFLQPEKTKSPKQDFQSWLAATDSSMTWNWPYQRYIYKRLKKIDKTRSARLMIFLPPRHGKSELVTIRYAAWRLRQDPRLRIIIGSYNQRLANRFSRKIRRLYLHEWFKNDLVTDAAEDQSTINATDEWETTAGGGVKAVGVGAGVTGFGADLIIIDDPVKSRAEAESKNNRDRIMEWFNDDLHTRLEPGGAIILIQTRWHDDDLAGRLLQEAKEGGEQWDVVCLPALAEAGDWSASVPLAMSPTGEQPSPQATVATGTVALQSGDPLGRKPGEALCPKRFDREALLAKQKKLGAYSFAALYQQRPQPLDGGLFKRSWFTQIVERAPEGLRWCRGYDLAVSTKSKADYTASFRCALDKKTGNLYVADGFRGRIEYPEQRRYLIGRIRDEPNTEHGIEEALHGQAFVQELRREERLGAHAFRGVRVTNDKFTRALAWANRAEEGKVILVRGAWIDEFLDEVCQFPNAQHDDQVDAVSLAVQMIERRKRKGYSF